MRNSNCEILNFGVNPIYFVNNKSEIEIPKSKMILILNPKLNIRNKINIKSEIEHPKSEITKTLLILQKYTYKTNGTLQVQDHF